MIGVIAGVCTLLAAAPASWSTPRAPEAKAPKGATAHNHGRPPVDSAAATRVRTWLGATLDSLDTSLATLGATPATRSADARAAFRQGRTYYKHVEALLQYYAAQTDAALNSPSSAELVTDGHPTGRNDAKGFQRIEPALFPTVDSAQWRIIADEVPRMRAELRRFRAVLAYVTTDEATLLDLTRLELGRVSTLGIAGLDAPLSRDGIRESADALRGICEALDRGAPSTNTQVTLTVRRAAAYLAAHPDFETFDRFAFITQYANPAFDTVGRARRAIHWPPPALRRVWPLTVDRIYDVRQFDASAFAPDEAPTPTPAVLALGRTLFFDPKLSGNGTRSCASCHSPLIAFTDGRRRASALSGGSVARNTPTLINAAFQSAQFVDARSATLESQLEVVLASEREMGSSLAHALTNIRADQKYQPAFAVAFPTLAHGGTSPVTASALRLALAAYVRSLTAFKSRFDRAMRGDAHALHPGEVRGFNVFMGKGGCGTCHFAPLFNGTSPPNFLTSELEVIGVPASPATHGAHLDPDSGRAAVDHLPDNVHAFKVPTVRNVQYTAPYMHNGVFRTLDDVVDFYDRGGGIGIGAVVPNQTLSSRPLHLTPREKRDLIAFLRALSDTVIVAPVPITPHR